MKRKIFILHGWAYDTDRWLPFVEQLKQKNVEPVLLKIPGLTAPLDEVWTLDNYVEWLRKIVDREKGLPAGRQGKVILLGHSNGGRISLAFSLKYPEKVSQLFLIDSAGIYHNELSLRIKRFVFGALAKIGKNIKNVKTVRTVFYKVVKEHDYEKANPILQQTMKNLINEDLSSALHRITMQTTIIWGEFDKMTPLKDGKLMHKEIKKSVMHVIKGARHSPQFTHTEEVVNIVYANF